MEIGLFIDIDVLLNGEATSNTAANLVPMPPNSFTKVNPASGGRHKMGCANADGASGMIGVLRVREDNVLTPLRHTSEYLHEA